MVVGGSWCAVGLPLVRRGTDLLVADRRLAEIAARQHGVFSHAQALSTGHSSSSIHRRVRAGVWRHVHTGVYALAGMVPTFRSACMAAVLAAGRDACVSHRCAARLYDLEGFRRSAAVEVLIGDRRGLRIPGVRVHRPRLILPGDVDEVAGIRLTSVERTVFDVTGLVPVRIAEPMLDDALRREMTTLQALSVRLDAVGNVPGVRGVGKMRALLAQRASDPGTESRLEVLFSRLIRAAGLPEPVAQYVVRRKDGTFVARVDFAYPAVKLAIELDGYAFHSGRQRFERDRARDNQLIMEGWTLLHFTQADVTGRARSVVRQLSLALGRLDAAARA